FAVDYFQFDNESDNLQFVSEGGLVGELNVAIPGSTEFSTLVADDAGESISAFHHLELHQTSIFAFKAIKFKRALVNGRFGLQIVSLEQQLRSRLLNSGGVIEGELIHEYNFNGFGPRFGIDYIRRVGHTPAQLVVSSTSTLLFGDQDQIIRNSLAGDFQQLGSDEFVTLIDIFMGIQTKKFRGEKRNTTMRVGFVNQSWIGGGTSIDPDGDFGFQGVSFMLGLNR
ncbi:MAG: Lpg1974 family pore-forming outer membrane protein, partial [Planctomycetota bacterium]